MSFLLPFGIFLILLITLFVSIRISGKVPVIESISPRIAGSGEILVIRGKSFGERKADGDVRIAGISPTASSYLEWSDTKISVRIPEDTGSGLVYVTTGNGKSNGILFTNRNHIPVVVSGPAKPGFPYIESVEPAKAYTGALITIRGMNFGINRSESTVYFAWVPSESSDAAVEAAGAGVIACSESDFDYEYWSDREVRVRVPSEAVSGNLFIRTDRGESNSAYFEILDDAGTRIFHDKVTFAVQNGIRIRDVAASPGNDLYLWAPQILESSTQRAVQIVKREPAPQIDNYRGSSLYHLSELETGRQYRISQSYMFDRYTVENRVKAAKIGKYDTKRKLYQAFTSPDFLIPSDDKSIARIARSVAGRTKNPYLVARAIYDYVRKNLEYKAGAPDTDILAALKAKQATSYAYSLLFTSLSRAAGIPARPVSGYLVDDTLRALPHYWAEFYLENYGWFPVDPALGDEPRIPNISLSAEAADFYFGSIENRHIAFSRGIQEVNSMDPRGKRSRKERPYAFLNFHEEAAGNIESYRSYWEDLTVTGIY